MVTFDYVVMSTASATDLQDYSSRDLADHVDAILDAVRRRGDDALLERRAAGAGLARVALEPDEIERCVGWVPPATMADLRLVQDRARRFAAAQRAALADFETDGLPGTARGRQARARSARSGSACRGAWPGGLVLSSAQAAVIAAVQRRRPARGGLPRRARQRRRDPAGGGRGARRRDRDLPSRRRPRLRGAAVRHRVDPARRARVRDRRRRARGGAAPCPRRRRAARSGAES